MKALVIEAPGSIEVREVVDPEIKKDDDVLIRVTACGICGTDIHILGGLKSAKYPVIPGHEFCGVVEDVGKRAAEKLRKGDRIVVDPNLSCFQCEACREGRINHCTNGMINQGVNLDGGFAEFARVNVKQCYRISEDVPEDVAVLGEPLSCVLHGLDKAGVFPSERVVVFGGGPIGVLIYKCLHTIMGVSDICIVEISQERISAARAAGVESITATTPQREADVVFEACGSVEAFEAGIRMLEPGGRLIQFGVPVEDAIGRVPLDDIYRKEISIIGSFVNPFTMGRAVELLSDYRKLFSGIAANKLSLEEARSVIRGEMATSGFLKAVVSF